MEWLVQMDCYNVGEAQSFNFLLLLGLTSIKKFRYHYRQNLSLLIVKVVYKISNWMKIC